MADVIILSGGIEQPDWSPRIRRSLGPYRIASALEKEGYSVAVIDYIQYMTAEEVIAALSKQLTPETLWVGYSSTFFFSNKADLSGLEKMYQSTPYEKIVKIYDYINANSGAKIVFGGAYALFPPADPRVDYYVAGYADNTALYLTNHIAGKQTLEHFTEIDVDGKKAIHIDSSKYTEPVMNSLETFWHKENYNLLKDEPVPLEFARGCIFKCKFCSYPLIGKRKGTYIRDMEQVRDEMVQLWETKGIDTFYMTDDTFNDDNDKMDDFHKLFTSLPFKPKFSAFLRLDLINKFPHQADLLLDAGLVGNFFGIESFNLRSARAIGKGLHTDKVKQRLHWVADKWKGKVNIGIGLIVGLPYDDYDYFDELNEYINSPDYPAHHTVINPLHIFDKSRGINLHGSEFSMNSEIYGYKFDSDGLWYHPEQKLDFKTCKRIAEQLANTQKQKEKIAEFRMITYLGMGVKLEDLLTKTEMEIHQMYNFPEMNREKILEYKTMIGAI